MKLRLLGFTLMELLVVVIIVALLALLAIPIYSNYLTYSRRTDAIQTLSAIQVAEESYRLTNNTYGTLAQVWSGSSSVSSYYTIAISNVTASSYTITATAVSSQANDDQNGTSCASMVLAFANNATTKTPAVCWSMS